MAKAQQHMVSRRILRHEALDIKVVQIPAPPSVLKKLIVVTSRKIGNAPQRNKVRRRIKALFHEQKLNDCPDQGTDQTRLQWVIITKPPIISLSFAELTWLISTTVSDYRRTKSA